MGFSIYLLKSFKVSIPPTPLPEFILVKRVEERLEKEAAILENIN